MIRSISQHLPNLEIEVKQNPPAQSSDQVSVEVTLPQQDPVEMPV